MTFHKQRLESTFLGLCGGIVAVLRLLFGGDIDWTGENTLDPITIKHTCKSVRTFIMRSPSAISIIIKPPRIMEIALGELKMIVLSDLQAQFIVMGPNLKKTLKT